LGLSKDRPSIVPDRGIRLPETCCPALPRGRAPRFRGARRLLRDGNACSHPRAALVVSHHLDGLFLLDPATVLQAAADPGVHIVSSCRETGVPAVHLLPFEAFPPPTAAAPERIPVTAGPRHRSDRRRSLRSPRTLPSRPFSPAVILLRFPARPPGESRGLKALLHRRVRGVHGRFRPCTLGAPLGLSDSPARAFLRCPPPRAGANGSEEPHERTVGITSKNTPESVSSV